MKFDKEQPKPRRFANAAFFAIKDGQTFYNVTIGDPKTHHWGDGPLKKDGKRDQRFCFGITTATGDEAEFSCNQDELHLLQSKLGLDSAPWAGHKFNIQGKFYSNLGDKGTTGLTIVADSVK